MRQKKMIWFSIICLHEVGVEEYCISPITWRAAKFNQIECTLFGWTLFVLMSPSAILWLAVAICLITLTQQDS